MSYRKQAKGKPCLVRVLPSAAGRCSGGGEDTVLAHYRLSGYAGVGRKPDDVAFGAYACAYCHDICDGRVTHNSLSRQQIRLYHAEGVMRTVAYLRNEGFF